jgi:hypothetical protein
MSAIDTKYSELGGNWFLGQPNRRGEELSRWRRTAPPFPGRLDLWAPADRGSRGPRPYSGQVVQAGLGEECSGVPEDGREHLESRRALQLIPGGALFFGNRAPAKRSRHTGRSGASGGASGGSLAFLGFPPPMKRRPRTASAGSIILSTDPFTGSRPYPRTKCMV